MEQKSRNKADRIIEAYFKGHLPVPLEKKIRDWYAGPEHRAEKDAALWNAWQESVNYDHNPRPSVYESLAEMRSRMGFPEESVTLSRRHFNTKPQTTPLRRIEHTRFSQAVIRVAAVVIPILLITGAAWIYLSRMVTTQQSRDLTHTTFVADVNDHAKSTSEPGLTTPPESSAHTRNTMSDGSQVLVNANSAVAETGFRKARLEGEAYFSVAKDAETPFVLSTEHFTVRVLGTKFNVRSAHDERYATVELYSGRVDILLGETVLTLTPGDCLRYDTRTGEYVFSETDGTLPSWVSKDLDFHQVSLGEVFKSLEWYYGAKIETAPGVNLNIPVIFKLYGTEPLATAMSYLQLISGDFTYTINPSGTQVNVQTN